MPFDLNAPASKAAALLHYLYRGLVLVRGIDLAGKGETLRGLRRIPVESDAEAVLQQALAAFADKAITPENEAADADAPVIAVDHLRHVLFTLGTLPDEALNAIAEHCTAPASGRDDPLYGTVIRTVQEFCEETLEDRAAAAPGDSGKSLGE